MGIEVATLILASSSLPVMGYGSYLYFREDALEGAVNILGGIYAFIGILLIPSGFPGFIIFPGTAAISSLGFFASYAKNGGKVRMVKGIIMAIVAALILVFQVML